MKKTVNNALAKYNQPGIQVIALFKSYFKLAVRNLVKNKFSSIINIVGLAIGIGGCIFAFMMVDRHLNLDAFHENAGSIFVVENIIPAKGEEQLWGNSPVPLGPALQKDFPQIIRFVRMNRQKAMVRRGDDLFNETIQFVDEGFLEMFTFPLKYGNKQALSHRDAVVLDEKTALRYFGDENPIGKQLTFIFHNKQKESFIVRGVTEELPETASFGFSILVNYQKQFKSGLIDQNNWKQLTSATFIQLSHPENIQTIAAGMNRYIELQNTADSLRPMSKFVFEPLRSMGRNTYKVRASISHISLHPSQVLQLPISTLFLLLLACFNYMNITIVSAARRVKEIGIRKVIGGTRLQLVIQFMGENLLLCLIALPLGIFFTEYIILPTFRAAVGDFFNLSIMAFTSHVNLWFFLVGLLLLTGFSAGTYPAFYISSFQPTHIFRGSQTPKGKRIFTRILLACQLIFSLMAVISGIVFAHNSVYQNNLDWGYHQEQVIVIPIDSRYYTMYKNEVDGHSNVLSTAGSKMHIGKSHRQVVLKTSETESVGEANKYAVVCFDVGFDYIETMGMRLKKGRSFDRTLKTDTDQAIIVNQTLVNRMGWQNAIGEEFFLENKRFQVIGVTEDFHYQVFSEKIEPVLLRISPEETYNYLVVKVRAETAGQTGEFLQKTWQRVIPAAAYTGFFQDDVFAVYLQIMENITIINIAWAIIFLFITCTGLFALVSLTISKRMKEISIRKVLGASLSEVIQLITRDFIILVIIASAIALPATYFLLNFLLDELIQYNVGVGPLALILGFVVVFAAALLTIYSQVYKAAVSNPVDSLRFE